MSDDLMDVLEQNGLHLETDVGYYICGQRLGPEEREEVFRAEMIDAMVAERQKMERRNFKGY